jgi:hypothetical protein
MGYLVMIRESIQSKNDSLVCKSKKESKVMFKKLASKFALPILIATALSGHALRVIL